MKQQYIKPVQSLIRYCISSGCTIPIVNNIFAEKNINQQFCTTSETSCYSMGMKHLVLVLNE